MNLLTLVGATYATGGAGSISVSGVEAGDLLVYGSAHWNTGGSAAISGGSPWKTLVHVDMFSSDWHFIAAKVAGPSEPSSYSRSGTGRGAYFLAVYRPSIPLRDDNVKVSGGASQSTTAPAAFVPKDGAIVFVHLSAYSSVEYGSRYSTHDVDYNGTEGGMIAQRDVVGGRIEESNPNLTTSSQPHTGARTLVFSPANQALSGRGIVVPGMLRT